MSRAVRHVRRARTLALGVALILAGGIAPAEAQKATSSGGEVSFRATGEARPRRLTGHLYRPDGPGPFPGMVLLHDCDGITAIVHRWGHALRTWGYVALLVDSFGPRNESSVCSTSSAASMSPQHERMPDAYAARRYLEAQPFVDRQRIGLMGWGHGGWTLLFAVDEVYLTEVATPPFKAAIALYPWCGMTRLHRLNAPLLILSGEADDWTPASLCRGLMATSGLQESSTPHGVTLRVYPGAHHRFDGFEPTGPYLAYTVGRHPEAAAQAQVEARGFLATHLAGARQGPQR